MLIVYISLNHLRFAMVQVKGLQIDQSTLNIEINIETLKKSTLTLSMFSMF